MNDIYKRLKRAFWFALATLFLVESWLWDHVKEWLRLLARALRLQRIEALLEAFVKDLSPVATLLVFAVPALVILPVKLAAVAVIAAGHLGYGLALILAAKTLGLGVTAYLFDLCRDKLMQIAWFARFYHLVLRVRAWAHDLVEPARRRIREILAEVRARLAPFLGASRGDLGRRLQLVLAAARRARGA
ncbi:MAG TPA: hypothetical protein VK446_09530 [Methylocystis sp.]|nr:hypothetical protein [Methylocystis sp.]